MSSSLPTISITGSSNDTNLVINSANAIINDSSSSIVTRNISDLQRLTMINLESNPVWYNSLATMKAYRDLYIPSMQLNKASVFSFGTAMGTLMRQRQGREYNFGAYSVNISSQLSGNYYDILLQESDVRQGPTVDGAFELSGSIVQIYPESGTGVATFTTGPAGTLDAVDVSGYAGWTDTSFIYTCGGDTIGNLGGHFCMPGRNNVSCLVAWKTIKDVASQFDNMLNVLWLVNDFSGSNHGANISATLQPIADLLNDGSMNITAITGDLRHPIINLNTTNTFAVPTKIWIKAGTQTATRKEILVARSWVNPVRDVEEFIEFMTIVIS